MRKRVLVGLVLALLIFNLAFVVTADEHDTETDTDADADTDADVDATADDETDTDADTEADDIIITPEEVDTSDVERAFNCLQDAVDGKCSSLSFEEKVFTVLSLGECKDELKSDSNDDKCWPKSGCNVKDTALAIWALSNRGGDTEDAENWLLSQNATPEEVSWYLEIETTGEASCKVSYSDLEYTVTLNEDKTISTDAGSCLSKSTGGYWLRISPSCYDKEFEVSCDEGFLTTLLYKRRDSSVIYVSNDATEASAEGKTSEKVDALCFANAGACDYEGSLWASLILDKRSGGDYELSPFFPYLVTMADQNRELLPESFLYLLLGHEDFRNNLLSKQRQSKYWDESGNKFYDTAVALLPFMGSSITEKQGSKEWLLEVQGDSGCFNNDNKRDTAFLLYSLWLEQVPEAEDDDDTAPDCEDSGGYCMSGGNCANNRMDGNCAEGVLVCCSVPAVEKTCESLSGEVCNSNQICAGVSAREDNSASDLSYGETCCIGGVCEIGAREEESTCETNSGYSCRASGCGSGEEEVSYETCDFESETCCRDETKESSSLLWLWITLIILIIIVIVAIIFRDKLRSYWYKIKGGGKKAPPSAGLPRRPSSAFGRPAPGRPGMSPAPGRPGMRPAPARPGRPMQKRTLPMRRPVPRINPRQKPRPELNQTLNKLKDMSKK